MLWHADPVSNWVMSIEVPVFRAYKHTLLVMFVYDGYTFRMVPIPSVPNSSCVRFKNIQGLLKSGASLFATINKIPLIHR